MIFCNIIYVKGIWRLKAQNCQSEKKSFQLEKYPVQPFAHQIAGKVCHGLGLK